MNAIRWIGQHSNKVRAFIWQAILVSVVMNWITLEDAQLAAWGMFIDAALFMFVETNTVSKVRVGERITEEVDRQMGTSDGAGVTRTS
jgi:hypothetical protein